MSPGTRVRHPVHGHGTVRRVNQGGMVWVVCFDERPQVPYNFPRSQLALIDTPTPIGASAGPQPAPPPPATAERAPGPTTAPRSAPLLAPQPAPTAVSPPAKPVTDDTATPAADTAPVPTAKAIVSSRQVLEALRLGVVPRGGLDRLTVGRDAERAQLTRLLDRGQGLLLARGDYGTGKTHLIELAESEALAAGWLVARCTFNADETPPSHPIRLYASLAGAIRYPDRPGQGLRPLFERLVGSAAHVTGERQHRWFSPVLWLMERGVDEHDAIAFVEGAAPGQALDLNDSLRQAGWRGANVMALPDYRTFGQIMAHLLGGIATWARDAGWRGLIVLADEAEVIDRLSTVSREMADNVMRYLATATLQRNELAFDPNDTYRGGHPCHREVPERFTEDQPLAVLMTLTPTPRHSGHAADVASLLASRDPCLELAPLRAADIPKLADRVLSLVRDVHPTIAPTAADARAIRDAMTERVRSGDLPNTRAAARMVVEYWDIWRMNPARAREALSAP
jgi:hypothetical protein